MHATSPTDSIEESIGITRPGTATVFFCNGPQCAATPDLIRTLLTGGYPPEAILYYRGGIHDWMTLGLPIEVPAGPASPAPGRARASAA